MDRRRDSGGQGWRSDGPPQEKSVSSYASLASGPPPSYHSYSNMAGGRGGGRGRGRDGGRGGGRYDSGRGRSFFRGGDRFENRQSLQGPSPDRSGYESGEISPVQHPKPSASENIGNRDERPNYNPSDGGRGDTSGRYIPRGGGRGYMRGGRGYRRGGRYFGGRGGRSDSWGRGRGRGNENWNSNPRNMGMDDSNRFAESEPPNRPYSRDPPQRMNLPPRDRPPPQGRYSSMINDSDGPSDRMDDRFGKRRRDEQGFQPNEYEDKRNRPNEYMHKNNNGRPGPPGDDHRPGPPSSHPRNDGPRRESNIGGPSQMSYDDPRARGGFERNDSRSRIAPINDDGPRGPPHRDDPRHQDPRHATRQEYPREEPRGLGGANQYDEAPPIKSYSALANPSNRNEWNSSQGNRPQRQSPVPPRFQGNDQGPQNSYSNDRGPPYEGRGGYGGRGRGRGFRGGRGRGRGGFGRFNHNSNDYFERGPRDGPDMQQSSYRSLDDGRKYDGPRDHDQSWSSSGKYTQLDQHYRQDFHKSVHTPPPTVESQEKKRQDYVPSEPPKVKEIPPKEEIIEEPKPPSPPPAVKPSGVMIALTRLADLEAQLEFAFAKHMQLVKKQKELGSQTKVLSKLPVGIEAFQEDLEAS